MKKLLVAKGLRIKKMKGAMGEVNKMTNVLWTMESKHEMQVVIKPFILERDRERDHALPLCKNFPNN